MEFRVKCSIFAIINYDSMKGIYFIKNKINNKIYIGKSINIKQRLASHKYYLRRNNRSKKHVNRFLYNSVQKYGWDNFETGILEEFPENFTEEFAKERELYWMKFHNSTNSDKGYNLRMDSSTNMIVHEKTRELISELVKGKKNSNYNNKWTDKMKNDLSVKIKESFKNGRKKPSREQALKAIEIRNKRWEENPELKQQMAQKVSLKLVKYYILQYDKQGKFIKKWDSIMEIIKENPNYKKHNIYAVCSGEKPTMYGYIWEKELKI